MCRVLHQAHRVPYAPWISASKTSLEISGLGGTRQVTPVTVRLPAPTSLTLQVQDPALPADPVGGDV